MTLQANPLRRLRAWLPAALAVSALACASLALAAPPGPEVSSFQIQARPVQKVPTTFKFQARISQAKLPVGDPVFKKVFVQLVRGTTDVVCSETLSNVRVKQSVLNLEIGRGFTCPLDDIIAANSDLNFRICVESQENCLKPVALSSVPYAIKATFSQQAQEAHTADVAAQCHYAHRVTADTGLLSLSNQSQYGSGYYDYATPQPDALASLSMPDGVTNTGGFIQWTPVAATSELTICQRGHGGRALAKLDVFNVQSDRSYFSNAVYVGADPATMGEGYLAVDGDGLFHGNVDIVGIDGAQEGTLTARSHIVSKLGNVQSESAQVIAHTHVRAETGDVVSESAQVIAQTDVLARTGDVVSESARVIAQTDVLANEGNVQALSGQVIARTDVLANDGNIQAQSGQVIAKTDVLANDGNIQAQSGQVIARTDVLANDGNIQAQSGQVIARTDVLANDGNIQAQSGQVIAKTDVLANDGNIEAQSGQVIAQTDLVARQGDVRAQSGAVVARTSVSAETGDIVAAQGQVRAQSGVVAATGNLQASAGDIIAIRLTDGQGTPVGGSVRAVDGVFSGDITAENGTVTANDGQFNTIRVGTDRPDGGFRVNADGTVVFGGVPQFGETVFSVEGHQHGGGDITSEISAEFIPSLPPSRIAASGNDRQFSAGLIPNLPPSRIAASGNDRQFSEGLIPNLPPSKVSGEGTFRADQIPSLDATKITSGQLNASRIPSLDAGKITSGQLSASRIPSLDAGKITSGTLSASRIPTLPASKIASGTLSASRIPSLDAGKITSGTLSTSRIPSLPASKITSGTLSTSRIPTLPASKITSGTLDPARIRVTTFNCSKPVAAGWRSGDVYGLQCSCPAGTRPLDVTCQRTPGDPMDFAVMSFALLDGGNDIVEEGTRGECKWRAIDNGPSGRTATLWAVMTCLSPDP